MKPVLKHFTRFLIVFPLLASAWGCASMEKIGQTKPNHPYQGPYPNLFDQIEKANSLLAEEILKLPEIQDGISGEEEVALNKLFQMYNDCSDDFDKAFVKMYKVGLPDVRKYCSPLQALFWLAEDGKLDETKSNPIFEYSLRMLLQTAWNYDDVHRWDDFQTVIERLNGPELLDYYERTRIHYNYLPCHGEDISEVGYVFKYNKGHCAQITAFTIYVLKRAGYKAGKRIITDERHASPMGNYHRVCVFEANGKKFVMDNGRNFQFGIIPYDQYNIGRHPYGLVKAFEEVWEEFQ